MSALIVKRSFTVLLFINCMGASFMAKSGPLMVKCMILSLYSILDQRNALSGRNGGVES